ncbi:MAG: hypothetical protein ACKO01_00030 [Erythrobacter sp.]
MPTLIGVYNADGGVLNALADMVHKIVSPVSYPCSLCALTYGPFAMRSAWRGWLERLGMPVLFLYRDEFRKTLDTRDLPLPVVLLGAGAGPPPVLVSAAELAALPDLAALIALLEARLAGVRR